MDLKKLYIALGIWLKRPVTGPLEVAIDISSYCNYGCITCWNYSPLNKEPFKVDPDKRFIRVTEYKRLVDELKKLSVKRVTLGGDGEPFYHPDVIEMIEYAKSRGLSTSIATHGATLSETKIKRIVDSGLDYLGISLHAATPETYLRMYPKQNTETFLKVCTNLKLLARYKSTGGTRLGLTFVVCHENYKDIEPLFKLAEDTGVDEVMLKRFDSCKETRKLLLTGQDKDELQEILEGVESLTKGKAISRSIASFKNYLKGDVHEGRYTTKYYEYMPCYAGWSYARILIDGEVIPCCNCYKSMGNAFSDGFEHV